MAQEQAEVQLSLVQDTEAPAAKAPAKRPHVYELDPLRVCTALGVIAVHVLFFTAALNVTPLGNTIQNAVVVAFHYTREVFIFVTAFALVYVYSGRRVAPLAFWKKRALGVVLPYVIWSVIYVLVNDGFTSPGAFLKTAVFDVVTGNASYQMYYILLTVQFYLFFPLFLPFIHFCARRPWTTLAVSFVLQVLFFYVDFHTIQTSSLHFWQSVTYYQDRLFLVYQFYFILGGLTALYLQQVRAFVLRYGRLVAGAFVLSLAGLWLHFALQVGIYGESVTYASSVLQPIMVFYSLVIVFFGFWLACRWARKTDAAGHPRGYRFWQTLSNASFGVYLIHALILTFLLQHLVPVLPTTWFVAARVFLIWFLTAAGATAMSVLLINIPIVSRLIGRGGPAEARRTGKVA